MAQRLQHKRSSVAGRRPDNRYLEPGELALNTNASDPGVYFELNDGTIAKAGPTSIGLTPPETEVGHGTGESWLDSGNRTLNTYLADADQWVPALSPLFGGDATLLFVGTNFDDATDSLSNDGSARPFSTLNRACIEVARRSILPGRSDKIYNNRFVIVLLPGDNIVENSQGLSRDDFDESVGLYTSTTTLSPEELVKFNPVQGGLILPRGTSIVGLDQYKTVIRPSFYPTWTRNQAFGGGDIPLQPSASTLLWTGNSFINSVTFRDKNESISVTSITGDENSPAVLRSLFPHGFRAVERDDDSVVTDADVVTLTYPDAVAQTYEGVQTIPSGKFWVVPTDQFTFQLLSVGVSPTSVLRKELPKNPASSSDPALFLNLTHDNRTHHRLSSIGWVSQTELEDFYYKVQRAFGSIPTANVSLNNTVGNAQVANPGETEIVAGLSITPSQEIDTVLEGSSRIESVSIRSNWGMNGFHSDGTKITGFKSADVTNLTAVLLQNDPEVYEIYYNNEWISLREASASFYSLAEATDAQAMEFLINVASLDETRYFYRTADDIEDQNNKSSGLVNPATDARHYCILAEDEAVVQVKSADVVGAAVSFWAKSGSRVFTTNCATALGGQSLKAEGFAGINTIGGALTTDQGFNILGIRRPAAITSTQLRSTENHAYIFINTNIETIGANTLTLSEPYDPGSLGPYTLRPGTIIWVRDLDTDVASSAVLSSDPVSPDGLTISLETANNNIAGLDPAEISLPYVRRFVDPRPQPQRSYHLWVNNTSSNHRSPIVGSVLRFDHTPSAGVSTLIASGRQLDPGSNGGWNHLFRVSGVSTKENGDRPVFSSESRSEVATTSNYYVSLDLCDSFKPWLGETDGKFYSRGQMSTYNNRVYLADQASLDSGTGTLFPSADTRVWTPAKILQYCQPVNNAWIPSDFTSAADPDTGQYDTDGDTYARGLSIEPSSYQPAYFIDQDNGTATLGLESATNPRFADPDIIDPSWMPSKAAMSRFLTLLGYGTTEVSSLLQPVRWSERNVSTTETSILPEPSGTGYATGKGPWAIEFCQSSRVVSTAHLWKEPGYLLYSKGLPRYQASGLTNRQRFDSVTFESWGGSVLTTGVTESNEFVSQRFVPVDGAGRTVPIFNGSPTDYISWGAFTV